MEENKTAEKTPPVTDESTPLLPDASSTGAEFSDGNKSTDAVVVPPVEAEVVAETTTDQNELVQSHPEEPKPAPSTDVADTPPKSETLNKLTDLASIESEVAAPQTQSKDQGTHRSKINQPSGGRGLAILVVLIGASLSVFVLFVYFSTNK